MTTRATWLAVTGLLALNPLAHLLYLGWVPGSNGWWFLWAGSTALLYPAVRPLGGRVVTALKTGGPAAVALPVVTGVVLAGWWYDGLLDVLWLHGPRGRTVLLPLMHLAHAVAAGSTAALLLAALVATDPPADPPRSLHPTPWAAVAGFAAAAGLFAGWYVGQERAVYPADYMYYWVRAADWAERLRADPPGGADEFRRAVQQDGYTLLPMLPHGVTMAALGDHREVFVLTTVFAYLPPLVACGIAFVRLAAPGGRVTLPVLLATGLFPGTWLPVLRGYPDVGGAALAVGTLVVYLGHPAGGLRWRHLLALTGLLVTLPVFRRWYAFWVVAFILLVGVDGLLAAAGRVRGRDWLAAARCLRPAAALGLLVPLGLAAVALPAVRQMVENDYAEAFQGYKAEQSLPDRLAGLLRAVGPAYGVAAGLAAGVLAAGPGRRPALFVAGMVPVMVAQFMRVQDFNPHHLYLLLPALTLLPAAVAARLPPGLLIPLAAGGGLLFVPVFAPDTTGGRLRVRPLGSYHDGRPLRRHDLDEFRRLAAYLAGRPPEERFLVLSSSLDLHFGMVASVGRSLRVPFPADRLLPTQEVDKVNGFPASVFAADLVLVPDPPQTHLRPAEQQVILLPAQQLLAGTGVGVAFDRLSETFAFDGGITMRVFRRARPVPPAALADLVARLRQAHPAHPLVFTPPPAVITHASRLEADTRR